MNTCRAGGRQLSVMLAQKGMRSVCSVSMDTPLLANSMPFQTMSGRNKRRRGPDLYIAAASSQRQQAKGKGEERGSHLGGRPLAAHLLERLSQQLALLAVGCDHAHCGGGGGGAATRTGRHRPASSGPQGLPFRSPPKHAPEERRVGVDMTNRGKQA